MTDHPSGDGVVVYYRPSCVYCIKLLGQLAFTRLRYRTVYIGNDPGARAFVRSVAGGNETVPTVVVAGRAMVNPSVKEVVAAAEEYAPQSLDRGRSGG